MRPRPAPRLPAVILLALALLLASAGAGAQTRAAAGSSQSEGRLRRDNPQRAVALFREALERDPTDPEAAKNLGSALSRLGNRAEAERAYRRAIELAPDLASAYVGLGDLFATDPRRWERREEVRKLLETGLDRLTADAQGRVSLTLSLARFERAVGRTQAARALLLSLDADLSPDQHKRVQSLLDSLEVEEKARALLDWPDEEVPDAARAAARAAEEALALGQEEKALSAADPLAGSYPGWRAARFLRARALEALGRYDETERELGTLLHIAPSHAEGWRLLGRTLANHGGALDADRADEALRHALALEPGYFDLWLLRARVALRRGKPDEALRYVNRYLKDAPEQAHDPEVRKLVAAGATGSPSEQQKPPHGAGRAPSAHAQELYREAREDLEVGDPSKLAPDLLAEALADSPTYVEAAATYYGVTSKVPERTVQALWQDPAGLVELAGQVRTLPRNVDTRRHVRRWLDRAVALGDGDARFERGVLRIDEGDSQGGLSDLLHYVAAEPNPARLEDARALLVRASAPPHAAGPSGRPALAVGRDPDRTLAQVRLLQDQPELAAAVLGGRCDDRTSGDRLLGLGLVHEWSGEPEEALSCYQQALRRAPASQNEARTRLSWLAARAPLALLGGIEGELRRAADQGDLSIPTANWALGRLFQARGENDQALSRLERFLHDAPPDDPNRPAARALREGIAGARARAAREVLRREVVAIAGAGAFFCIALLFSLRATTLSRGLLRRPALFPEVARTIGELRHDVLKHRTSVLGLLAAGEAPREEVRRVLWEPERASDLIAAAYDRLRSAARGKGVKLRRLGGEPAFGPLVRDLRQAEALLRQDGDGPAALRKIDRIDARLRGVHAERLLGLLRLGPRTRLDAALLSAWICDVEAEVRVRGGAWTSPVLHFHSRHGVDLGFPVERGALFTIFANLLRNAQAAVAGEPGAEIGGVIVRVAEERDATGKRQVLLLIGDSARAELSLADIEQRQSGRGLSIVRDLVHEWRGHLVLRQEDPPYNKGVGACFPG